MAAVRKRVLLLLLFLCFISIFINTVYAVRTKNKIYIDLKTQSACFRNLNATHQAGCTSESKGNVGTVHYVQTYEDFEWILYKGPHAPYVALLNSEDFNGTSVRQLYQSSRVNGIMVINLLKNSTHPPSVFPAEGFSSVDTCPNDKYGMYSKTGGCNSFQWNPAGTSLYFQDIGIPVFALSDPDDVDAVLNKCFYPFNNQSRSYPVCAAEVKARMDAAIDSVTCLRRSNRFALSLSGTQIYCDPLGDKNVIVTMKDVVAGGNETRENGSVILVGARLDSTSLFQYEYQAADTTAVGIVAMLATAEALWKVKNDIRKNETAKDIMFAFFQGETFDYIGSSRMVYDMNLNQFPQENSKKPHLHHINLIHLDQIVELNQVGRRDDGGHLWSHTGGYSNSTKVEEMVKSLQELGKNWNVSIQQPNKDQPLPPASAQRFLKHMGNIPTVVITDHNKSYTNKFYNSRFDVASLIDADGYPHGMNQSEKYDFVTRQAELITNLSTTLAQYLYKASMGSDPPQNLKADPLTVTHLLYCFLVSPACELFKESVETDDVDSLKAKQPFPFYVSVKTQTTWVTQLVRRILARFTGEIEMMHKKGECLTDDRKKQELYSYIWMQGTLYKDKDGDLVTEGWCVNSTVYYTEAVSPAFEIEDYDMLSGEYSTWTESRWANDAFKVRLFLLPSQQFQINVLAVGLLMLVVSLALVYFCQLRSSIIFGNNVNDGSFYNPMT